MDRLSALDAAFLFAEDGRSHMDIGMVLEFANEPMTTDQIVTAIRDRIPLVPRYRQKIRIIPGAAALPVWVDDVDFDVARHVFETRAEPEADSAADPAVDPDADSGLFAAVSRVMSSQLDRNKPLWEVHLISGLSEQRWALVIRMHHCMVDGVASTDIVATLLSQDPKPPEPIADDWVPVPPPSDWDLVQDAVEDNLRQAADAARQVASSWTVSRPAPPARLDVQPVRSLGLPIADATVNGPIGAGRRFKRALFPLSDVKAIRAGLDGTVNDIFLSVCARAFRDLLLSRGEPVEGRLVRTLVPVALRTSADGQVGNQISGMPVELPLGDISVVQTLDHIRRQTQNAKQLTEAMSAVEQTSMPGFGLPVTLTLGSRLAAALPSYIHTVTSNVPGPQHPLYLHGRELEALSACIALWAPMRIAVQLLSYNGTLGFAVVGDAESMPDLDVFLDGARRGLMELAAAARDQQA